MKNSLARFLGDTPSRVAIKLVVLSVVVGVIMSAVGLTPRKIFDSFIRFFERLWNLGFDAIYSSLEYLFIGAAVVVPIFIIVRLLSYRSPRS